MKITRFLFPSPPVFNATIPPISLALRSGAAQGPNSIAQARLHDPIRSHPPLHDLIWSQRTRIAGWAPARAGPHSCPESWAARRCQTRTTGRASDRRWALAPWAAYRHTMASVFEDFVQFIEDFAWFSNSQFWNLNLNQILIDITGIHEIPITRWPQFIEDFAWFSNPPILKFEFEPNFDRYYWNS
jgi:hypothetical protein